MSTWMALCGVWVAVRGLRAERKTEIAEAADMFEHVIVQILPCSRHVHLHCTLSVGQSLKKPEIINDNA